MSWAGGTPGDYTDAQWIRACVMDTGTGAAKSRFKLPIRDPQGGISKQGIASATDLIGHVKGVSPEQVATAARSLQRARKLVGLDPDPSLATYARSRL